jgi:hypothetical protein
MVINRHGAWLAAAAAFGTLVLPALVYFTGITVLGPYAAGGLGTFYADFLTDLARLRWHAWALALGPLAVVAIWRLLTSRSLSGTA